MRTFVIGSKELSCIILETLLAQGHEVLGVFSRDNEPGMRVWHEDLGHRSLAALAQENGIPVHLDQKVNSAESLDLLHSLDLDVIFSCFWSELFKEDILSVPKLGVFNFHTAYLPRNRGSRPIPWALIHGDEVCGVTLHKMLTGVDNGPIVDQEAVAIGDDDTARSLYDKVMEGARRMFERSLGAFASGDLILKEQDEQKATYQLRGEPYGGQIHATWAEERRDRFKRAMHFSPFRGHRPSPQSVHSPGVRLLLIDKEGYVLTAEEDRLLRRPIDGLQPYRTRLTGGDSIQRRALRDWAGEVKDSFVLMSKDIDLSEYFPVLECLQRRRVHGVISRHFGWNDAPDIHRTAPFRHHNGLLNIPLVWVDRTEQAMTRVNKAVEIVTEFNIPVYVTLQLERSVADETLRLLLEENASRHIRSVGFNDLYNEFDTVYEDLST